MAPAIRSALLFALGACGDDLAPELGCPVAIAPISAKGPFLPVDPACLGAMRFAAKHSPTLTPSQEMMDRYWERWARANEAEPAFPENGGPQRYRGNPSAIHTTNPLVIAALTPVAMTPDDEPTARRIPVTGDTAFDAIMLDLVVPEIAGAGVDHSTGGMIFSLRTGAIFNQELLHTRLLETSSRLPDSLPNPYQPDGIWRWEGLEPGEGTDEATALIDMQIGWGDCFVTCSGLRNLRAVVPPIGAATVYDLGGDPLPPNITLSPNTVPNVPD